MGWNGSNLKQNVSYSKRGKKDNVPPRSFISAKNVAVLFCIGVILALTVVFIRSDKSLPDEHDSTENREIKPKPPKEKPVEPGIKPEKKKTEEEDPRFKGLPKDRIRKTAAGDLIYLPRVGEERFPGERAQALALIGGKAGSAMIDKRLVEDPKKPWMFRNAIQTDLVQYCRPGEFAAPINPNISDKAAWDAINTPIEFRDSDSDVQLEEKQMVKDMIAELKAYMEKGGHARDYFTQLQHRQEMEADIMLTTRQHVHEILNSGDIEGAKKALNVYNQYRKEKGLPPMRVRRLNGPSNSEIQQVQ